MVFPKLPFEDISDAFNKCFSPSIAIKALYASGQLLRIKLTRMHEWTCISTLVIHLGIISSNADRAPD